MQPIHHVVPVALLQLLISSDLWAQTPAAAPVAVLSTQPELGIIE